MKTLLRVIAIIALALVSATTLAADEVKLESAPLAPDDAISLQSGARTFVNYCLNCHSAALLRYSQLTRLGLTEQQIKDNLMFTGGKIGDVMKVAANAGDLREWFGANPPDLSVTARSRGVDWLYGYLRGFYRDPERASGWNNTVYKNVAMPHVLWTLQGERLAQVEMVKEHGEEHKVVKLSAPVGGSMTPIEYDRTIADLVSFMSWMAEPHALERKRIGYLVLIGLAVLVLMTYLLKASYWKDVH